MSNIRIVRRSDTIQEAPFGSTDEAPAFLMDALMARGIQNATDIHPGLDALALPDSLCDIDAAANLLADAVEKNARLLIIGDYDVDGASSTVLAIRALRSMGMKNLSYKIPSREYDGYGLTVALINELSEPLPEIILTVDNGIRSHEAVESLKKKGCKVIICDHHLPDTQLPNADAVVNPNRADCPFPGKNLAGVGVCFYLMCHLRKVLRERKYFLFKGMTPPSMSQFLDLVALGTIADMVPMDQMNRILVQRGLQLIGRGKTLPGLHKLIKNKYRKISASVLAFDVIPVLNSAGRLDDMSLSVDFLLEEDSAALVDKGAQLQKFNNMRKKKNILMQAQANRILETQPYAQGICLYDAQWHIGLIGLLAGKLTEKYSVPAVILTVDTARQECLRGSARSTGNVRLNELFAQLEQAHPGMLLRYGGHEQAAGITIAKKDLADFQKAYFHFVSRHLQEERIQECLTDGSLPAEYFTEKIAELLENYMPWGQEFPAPLFDDIFSVLKQDLSSGGTLKLELKRAGLDKRIIAVRFNYSAGNYPIASKKVHLVYRLFIQPWINSGRLSLKIEHLQEIKTSQEQK